MLTVELEAGDILVLYTTEQDLYSKVYMNNLVRLTAIGELVWRITCDPPVWTLSPPPLKEPRYDPADGSPLGPSFYWLNYEIFSPDRAGRVSNSRYFTQDGREVKDDEAWGLAVHEKQTLRLVRADMQPPSTLIASAMEWSFAVDTERGIAKAVYWQR